MVEKAIIIRQNRQYFDEHSFAEIKIWKIPKDKNRPHGFKYSLVYIKNEKRIIGYDNSEGKGDHRHYEDIEQSYFFKNIDTMIEDFNNDVKRCRNEN